MTNTIRTRFAPSPTGYLHRGHALSALYAFDFAQKHGGEFLLRIEDIDTVRCREDYIQPMLDDLTWLGLSWPEPVRRQSQHFEDYQNALSKLDALGVLYPCTCTRKQIQAAHPVMGKEGPLYPGLCKGKALTLSEEYVIRLDLEKAENYLRDQGRYPTQWLDLEKGMQQSCPLALGDVVLSRKDTPTSYHLSVVVDDALQGITHVIRGMDLFYSTHIHAILQALLEFEQPTYIHHQLMVDAEGKKFSKRDKSETLQSIREQNACAAVFIENLPLR
ncbi:tRNA glutamyl-Q(34) synthetase GluQRS [Temperatibacter marinus]|uniref:tRNA glutamyl-Q(34) synthetase GluQRS n=1 Tax=Temperatibacter marinus TaxID=1456591 RepID=A0AA52EFT7_9PROT|nr:tRNA glutamyl-Q(34) synthetase GluQRS [Temperatibacter marinus]WND03991.1 tRNA glutamyl-Q(34) synthetase GluQRS [Temperatibacter marinus]